MATIKKIKVLIVDDSLFFREFLARGLSADPILDVVAKAKDPFDARDKILKYRPDVMTCDVEMPKMNGIEFVKRLLSQYKMPVIIVSSIGDAAFEAMKIGAIDFVSKPDTRSSENVESFLADMIYKIKIAARSNIVQSKIRESNSVRTEPNYDDKKVKVSGNKIIAMGASTGGTEAIFNILKKLPTEIPGILIVQHIPPMFSKLFVDRMNDQLPLKVKEAENGDYVQPGTAYVAPGSKHMRIRKIGNNCKINLFAGERRNGHCPSVDVLFESVADSCGKNAIGIILTGMGYDGVKGLMAMRRKGAKTIGQDENTSVVYGMPKAAFDIGAVEEQMPLDKIPQAIISFLN
ncbi:protein-glutamate methylesterase/protein-glutamine glutaminase [Natranaerofaba carboxydovora]|uniref:protein-glutamate methylesterase/protein-glutamine glutaminase n=1 Tax=Natranaerofaba carboxydovora TaxID=2742683 RepID=UPI001F13331A|nr:chemotaxis response regulator protein-glutamate methylesterase [Natranaerofaba carboxydovora]UMZ73050.1 Chemotaxis response regulator protein-glutamate methylesterase [Natranaerofaba carboxydovora]